MCRSREAASGYRRHDPVRAECDRPVVSRAGNRLAAHPPDAPREGQRDHRAPTNSFPEARTSGFTRAARLKCAACTWRAPMDLEPRRLVNADAAAVDASGHLLFPRQGDLLAAAVRCPAPGTWWRGVQRSPPHRGQSRPQPGVACSLGVRVARVRLRRTCLVTGSSGSIDQATGWRRWGLSTRPWGILPCRRTAAGSR